MSKPRRPLSAFTLLELLIVIAVIAILAALIINTAGMMQVKSARSLAQSQIAAMSTALEHYKADMGDYPSGTNVNPSGNNNFLYTALSPATGTRYYEFPKNAVSALSGITNVVDPFGNSYCYQYPGAASNSGSNFFDLYSVANDSTDTNTNVWIKNW